MQTETWAVLAAYYPPNHIGGGEVSDHWIFREAVQQGVSVTVWCESSHESSYVYEGVTVRCSPSARQQLYAYVAAYPATRVFLSGPITVVPWKLPPSTRPTLLLRSQSYLPLVRQLAPILRAIIVPSPYFKEIVQRYQPTFPDECIYVSYPNIPRIQTLPRRNPRFITTVSAQSHKGIDLFVAVSASMPDHDFLVADALHQEETMAVSQRTQAQPNLFISMHHERMMQIYFITQILLAPTVPSMHVETFGKAIAEALLYGIPALTYRYGAPQEYLDPRLFVDRCDDSFMGQVAIWNEKIRWCVQNPVEVTDAVRLSAERLRALQLPTAASQIVHTLRAEG